MKLTLPGYKSAKQVLLTGNFDDWKNSVVTQRRNDKWEAKIDACLDTRLEFQFVVDDVWVISSSHDVQVDNQGCERNFINVIDLPFLTPNESSTPEELPNLPSLEVSADLEYCLHSNEPNIPDYSDEELPTSRSLRILLTQIYIRPQYLSKT